MLNDYWKIDEFVITEEHIKLLKNAYIGWDDCEYGAPAINCKRPYGNSSVENDICQILDWTLPEYDTPEWNAMCDKARKIHEELLTVLQILVANSDKGIQPGTYRCNTVGSVVKQRTWKRVETV